MVAQRTNQYLSTAQELSRFPLLRTIAVDFLRCNLFIKDPIPAAQWFNIQDASISYNGDRW